MEGLHIHAPDGEYVAQVRLRGHRLWQEVATRNSAESAMIQAVAAMGARHHRARVLWCCEHYDPVVVMRLSR